MSVTLDLFAIATADVARLKGDPARLHELFDPYDQQDSPIKYTRVCYIDRAYDELHGILTGFETAEPPPVPSIWTRALRLFRPNPELGRKPVNPFPFIDGDGDLFPLGEEGSCKFLVFPEDLQTAWSVLEPLPVDLMLETKFDFPSIKEPSPLRAQQKRGGGARVCL